MEQILQANVANLNHLHNYVRTKNINMMQLFLEPFQESQITLLGVFIRYFPIDWGYSYNSEKEWEHLPTKIKHFIIYAVAGISCTPSTYFLAEDLSKTLQLTISAEWIEKFHRIVDNFYNQANFNHASWIVDTLMKQIFYKVRSHRNFGDALPMIEFYLGGVGPMAYVEIL